MNYPKERSPIIHNRFLVWNLVSFQSLQQITSFTQKHVSVRPIEICLGNNNTSSCLHMHDLWGPHQAILNSIMHYLVHSRHKPVETFPTCLEIALHHDILWYRLDEVPRHQRPTSSLGAFLVDALLSWSSRRVRDTQWCTLLAWRPYIPSLSTLSPSVFALVNVLLNLRWHHQGYNHLHRQHLSCIHAIELDAPK